jgi:hypothetical protein
VRLRRAIQAGLEGTDIFRLEPLVALHDVEFDFLVLLEGPVAASGDGGEMREDIRAARVLANESESPFLVEPFDRTCCHFAFLHWTVRQLPLAGPALLALLKGYCPPGEPTRPLAG